MSRMPNRTKLLIIWPNRSMRALNARNRFFFPVAPSPIDFRLCFLFVCVPKQWISNIFRMACECVEQLFVQSLVLYMLLLCLTAMAASNTSNRVVQNLKRFSLPCQFYRSVATMEANSCQIENWEREKKTGKKSLVQIGCSLHSPTDFQSQLSQFTEMGSRYFDVFTLLFVCCFCFSFFHFFCKEMAFRSSDFEAHSIRVVRIGTCTNGTHS